MVMCAFFRRWTRKVSAIWERKSSKTETNAFRRRIAESCRRYEPHVAAVRCNRYKPRNPSINRANVVHVGETAASGAGAGEGHEGDGAGDAPEGEGGRAFQDLG